MENVEQDSLTYAIIGAAMEVHRSQNVFVLC